MVSVGYLIDNPGGPSAFMTFVNQRVIPPAVDGAGAVESAVYELGERVRARPASSLLTAGALGLVFGAAIFSLSRRKDY
ncbi:MAG: hypothetical protein HIU92_09765 [Proteobacteria bacterium]|nr:hypothetical protein [Pseudomonadota bacterium]